MLMFCIPRSMRLLASLATAALILLALPPATARAHGPTCVDDGDGSVWYCDGHGCVSGCARSSGGSSSSSAAGAIGAGLAEGIMAGIRRAEQRRAQERERARLRAIEEERERQRQFQNRKRELLQEMKGGTLGNPESAASRGRLVRRGEAQSKKRSQRRAQRRAPKGLSLKSASADSGRYGSTDPNPVISSDCTNAVSSVWSMLDQFHAEADQQGWGFARSELESAATPLRDEALRKLNLDEYHKQYGKAKKQLDEMKSYEKDLRELDRCVKNPTCDLDKLHERFNAETEQWLKDLAPGKTADAMKRVDKARSFMQRYARDLEQASEQHMMQAAHCLVAP